MEFLDYNCKTGELIWRVDRGANKVKGTVAGSINSNGYRVVHINTTNYRAAILIWLWVYGEFPPIGFEVDHKNRCRDDNSLENLSLVSAKGNSQNRSKPKECSSKFVGVVWNKAACKWLARYTNSSNKRVSLGYFTDELAAAISVELHQRKTKGDLYNEMDSVEYILAQQGEQE